MKYTCALALLLYGSVFASPLAVTKRNPDTVTNTPTGDKDCNGTMYSPSEIEAVVKFAWQVVQDGREYSELDHIGVAGSKADHKSQDLRIPRQGKSQNHTHTDSHLPK